MLNKIFIMGRLTRAPELRTTQTGNNVVSFTVAVDRDFQSGGEKKTDFINVVAWKKTAEFVSRFFTKGSMIVVEGRLESRKWKDKNGNDRIEWEVQADNVHFGEAKRQAAPSPDVEYTEVDDDEELPFD